jgi:hypothetical protein
MFPRDGFRRQGRVLYSSDFWGLVSTIRLFNGVVKAMVKLY